MSRSMQWLSLFAGAAIFVYGIVKLFSGDWIPFVLGLLIVGFSCSKIAKSRQQEKEGADGTENRAR